MANLSIESRKKNIIVDMVLLYKWLIDKYHADDVYIFTGYLMKYTDRYNANQEIGYKYIFKDVIFNRDENKIKANCDVDIAVNGTLDTVENNLCRAILVTSDGDFLSLIKFWLTRSVIVSIISPADPDKCSYLLKKDNIPITYLRQIVARITNEKALDEDETS